MTLVDCGPARLCFFCCSSSSSCSTPLQAKASYSKAHCSNLQYLPVPALEPLLPLQLLRSSFHSSLLPDMSAYSMSLVIALVLAAVAHTTAQTALSAWMPGVATNYGGPSEGMDPNTPSYGLSNVSQKSITLACPLTSSFTCICPSTLLANSVLQTSAAVLAVRYHMPVVP